jgi:hypothetical protein
VAASDEILKELDVGPHGELSGRPNPQALALQFIPALVAILHSVEQKTGSVLSRAQVEALRDRTAVMAVSRDAAAALEQRRGYRDIDPMHCWEQGCLGARLTTSRLGCAAGRAAADAACRSAYAPFISTPDRLT